MLYEVITRAQYRTPSLFINLRKFYRYPVKGLSGEPLPATTLTPGLAFPHDRRFALARPGTRFDPDRPES